MNNSTILLHNQVITFSFNNNFSSRIKSTVSASNKKVIISAKTILSNQNKKNLTPQVGNKRKVSTLTGSQQNNKREKIDSSKSEQVATIIPLLIPFSNSQSSEPNSDVSSESYNSDNGTSSDDENSTKSDEIVNGYKLTYSGKKPLNTPAWRKAIKTAFTIPTDLNGVATLNFDDEELIVQKDGNKLDAIYHFSHVRPLGEGAFGKVVSVNNIIKNEKVALKIAKTEFQPTDKITEQQCKINKQIAASSIERGHQILMKLNANGPQRGVMEKPGLYVQNKILKMDQAICSLDKFTKEHIHADKFDFDLFCLDIVAGARYFYQIGFHHSDMKPANVLIFLKDGKLRFRHADLDGGLFNNELSHKQLCGAFTPAYLPEDDRKCLSESLKTGLDRVKLAEIHMRQNVFCLGWIIKFGAKLFGHNKLNSLTNNMILPKNSARPHINDVYFLLIDRILNSKGQHEGVYYHSKPQPTMYTLEEMNYQHPWFRRMNFDSIFMNLVSGVRYFNEQKFIVDINMENVLLLQEGDSLVARLSFANGYFLDDESVSMETHMKKMVLQLGLTMKAYAKKFGAFKHFELMNKMTVANDNERLSIDQVHAELFLNTILL